MTVASLVLPNPVSQCDSFPTSQVSSDGSLGRCKTKYHLRDLFVAPSFDELDAVAVDGKGEPRRLTGKQLEYIRERGYVGLLVVSWEYNGG
jgi:hypothetical protein